VPNIVFMTELQESPTRGLQQAMCAGEEVDKMAQLPPASSIERLFFCQAQKNLYFWAFQLPMQCSHSDYYST
jgi:hypothetical protein